MEKIVASSLLELKEKASKIWRINVLHVEDEDGYRIHEESFQTHDPKEPLVLITTRADLEICHTLKSAHKGKAPINEDEGEKVMESITKNALATPDTNGYTQELFNRDAVVKDVNVGSLIITVECLSLKALKNLWTEYCTGELNKVAERCLITEEIKSQHGVRDVKLRTYIDEDDYTRCVDVLLRRGEDNPGHFSDLNEFDETSLIWIAANVVQEKFKIPLLSIGDAKVGEPQLVSPGPVDTSHNLKENEESLKPQKVAVLVEHSRGWCSSPPAKMKEKRFENFTERVELAVKKGGADVLILVTNSNLSSQQKEELKGLPDSESGIRRLYTLDCEEILEIINNSPVVLSGVHWIYRVSQVAKRAAEIKERKRSMEKLETEDKRKIELKEEVLDLTKTEPSTSGEDSGVETVMKVLSFSTELPSEGGLTQSKQVHEESERSKRKRKRELAKATKQPSEPKKKIARKKIPATKKGPWKLWLVTPLEAIRARKCAGCKKKLKGSGAAVTELCVRHSEFDHSKGSQVAYSFKGCLRTYHLDRACITRRHDDFDDLRHLVASGVKKPNDIVLTEKQRNQAEQILRKEMCPFYARLE